MVSTLWINVPQSYDSPGQIVRPESAQTLVLDPAPFDRRAPRRRPWLGLPTPCLGRGGVVGLDPGRRSGPFILSRPNSREIDPVSSLILKA